MEFILRFDDKIIKFIDRNMHYKILEKIMRFISALGNNGAVWICMAVGLIAAGGEKRKAGLLMLGSLAAEASVCNLVIKPAVGRIRPNDAHGLVISIDRPEDYSFPSGHTAASFAAAYSLCLSGCKHGAELMCAAALMGFSRIYLLVHYPMDVLAGAGLGMASALSVHKIYRKKVGKD